MYVCMYVWYFHVCSCHFHVFFVSLPPFTPLLPHFTPFSPTFRSLYLFSRDLSTILSISPDLDVKAMLQTLQKTVDFEQLLAKKFSTTATGQYTRDGKGLEDDKDAEDELRAPVGEEDDDIIERDPHSVDAIKAKYRKHIREKKRVRMGIYGIWG